MIPARSNHCQQIVGPRVKPNQTKMHRSDFCGTILPPISRRTVQPSCSKSARRARRRIPAASGTPTRCSRQLRLALAPCSQEWLSPNTRSSAPKKGRRNFACHVPPFRFEGCERTAGVLRLRMRAPVSRQALVGGPGTPARKLDTEKSHKKLAAAKGRARRLARKSLILRRKAHVSQNGTPNARTHTGVWKAGCRNPVTVALKEEQEDEG
jgi:hypothetical protein